ncbi:MAG TPA: HesA/MoeB/ThiF family protein [Solirubrobacterales bacterium]|nr:HesA/MoeB/ThiF family protein [Solirubrobacterales bacterium]
MSEEPAALQGRYARQLLIEGWGAAVQDRLLGTTVFVVGAGALGSAAATYLVGAGVGRVSIVEGGQVELSQLHSQSLHFGPDIGASKAESAAIKLSLMNPEVHVDPFPAFVDDQNADLILEDADCVLDCSNDVKTAYLINDSCTRSGTSFATAAVTGFDGRMLTVNPRESACLRCIRDKGAGLLDEQAETAGLAGPAAGVVGSLQALEALKIAAAVGEPSYGKLLTFNGRKPSLISHDISQRADCTCANAPGAATV